jgi:hypothetical protein
MHLADIHNTALILIDHPIKHPVWHGMTSLQDLQRNLAVLRKFAIGTGMPIVWMSDSKATCTHTPNVHVVQAWEDEAFKEICLATQKNHFLIAGATTDSHIVGPAIRTLDQGFNAHVVQDACGASHAIDEALVWRHLDRSGVQLHNTRSIVAELVDHWSSPVGAVAFSVLM